MDNYELGDIELLSGETLLSAKLVYKTYGALNSDKNNVILLPTFYTGTHKRNEGFFGANRAINPEKHFIISINLFGNGLSTSPSNADKRQRGSKFPTITLWDNIKCQHELLTKNFNIEKIALVTGWSMAGCQSYQWAAQYPDMVEAILPFCASAKTSEHNFVFFREKKYKELGFKNVEELLFDWENDHVNNWDANNLLTKLLTWQQNDISTGPIYNNNFTEALNRIKAKAILMPCSHDLYFPPEDNEFELKHMQNAELRKFDSIWGHCVANPGNDKSFEIFLDAAINDLLY